MRGGFLFFGPQIAFCGVFYLNRKVIFVFNYKREEKTLCAKEYGAETGRGEYRWQVVSNEGFPT